MGIDKICKIRVIHECKWIEVSYRGSTILNTDLEESTLPRSALLPFRSLKAPPEEWENQTCFHCEQWNTLASLTSARRDLWFQTRCRWKVSVAQGVHSLALQNSNKVSTEADNGYNSKLTTEYLCDCFLVFFALVRNCKHRQACQSLRLLRSHDISLDSEPYVCIFYQHKNSTQDVRIFLLLAVESKFQLAPANILLRLYFFF